MGYKLSKKIRNLICLLIVCHFLFLHSELEVGAQTIPDFSVTEVKVNGKDYYKVSGVRLNDDPYRYFQFGITGESSFPNIVESMLEDLIWDYEENKQQKFKYHTGWSAIIKTYRKNPVGINENGFPTHWEETHRAATKNGYPGTVYKYADVDKFLTQKIGKNGYTQEIHDLIVQKNPNFTVLGDSRIETITIDSLQGGLYNPPSAATNPKPGDTFLLYYDNDVYVDVYVEKKDLTTITCAELGTCPDIEIPEGACPQPKQVPAKYDYELDLKVNRLDSRTVDVNTNTKTDVYIERADFSSNRNKVKQEFNDYISETRGMLTDCEAIIADFESSKAEAEASKNECLAKEVKKGDPPPDCSSFDETISKLTEEINKAKAFIPIYNDLIAKANQEIAYIQTEENKYRIVNTYVILTYDGNAVSRIDVSLAEGETQRHTFPLWNVTKQSDNLMAQINSNGSYQEFRYSNVDSRTNKVSLGYNTSLGNVLYPNTSSNNWKDVTQYIATYLTNSCPQMVEGQYFKSETLEGVVRAINDNGNKRLVKERLDVSFSKLPDEKIRAGSGVNYRVLAVYKNDDSVNPIPNVATGTKSVESYFPTQVNYQNYERGKAKTNFQKNGSFVYADEGYTVPHESLQNPVNFNETREWLLPKVVVEKFSGDVFTINNEDHLKHPARNPDEELIFVDDKGQPLRNWYTSFTQPDGDYKFTIRTYDAGINHLNTCHVGITEISGSVVGDPNENHDFVKRSVDAQTPFPTGEVGWNWNGYVNMLTDLTPWYKQWEITDPKKASLNAYEQAIYLTPKTMEKINKFTKENPNIKKGDSIIEELNLPTKKE